ncbi:MAG: hypothetical protein ACRDP3_08625, partial [Streptomyces sp.]
MTGVGGVGGQAVPGMDAAPVYAAMVCLGAAAWLLAGRDDGGRRARLLLAGAARPAERDPLSRPRLPPGLAGFTGLSGVVALVRDRFGGGAAHAWWCLLGGAVAALLGESWLPLLGGVAAVPLVRRWL